MIAHLATAIASCTCPSHSANISPSSRVEAAVCLSPEVVSTTYAVEVMRARFAEWCRYAGHSRRHLDMPAFFLS
jgi:hypothetical protein